MNELPNFTPYGYRLREVISNNSEQQSIIYKAVKLSTNDYVIIKQFQFASSQNLDNISISQHLETIEHPDGFCIVQPIMNELPDFTPYGYRLLEVLSNNIEGKPIIYRAIQLSTNDYVFIKQANFTPSTSWEVNQRVEQKVRQEIKILPSLKHSGIPNYLGTIDHPDGICLVQDYIDAQNFSSSRIFDFEQIKSITTQLLEILDYLQSSFPPIFHLNITPETVLYDEQNGRVY